MVEMSSLGEPGEGGGCAFCSYSWPHTAAAPKALGSEPCSSQRVGFSSWRFNLGPVAGSPTSSTFSACCWCVTSVWWAVAQAPVVGQA